MKMGRFSVVLNKILDHKQNEQFGEVERSAVLGGGGFLFSVIFQVDDV